MLHFEQLVTNLHIDDRIMHTYACMHAHIGQNRSNMTAVNNPNWLEGNQLAIYRCSRDIVPPGTNSPITQNEL